MKISRYIVLLIVFLIFSSCNKKNSDIKMNNDNKIETRLEGSGYIYADKHTTLISDKDMKKLDEMMSKMYYKTTTKGSEVGIISHGSCGQYKTLEVFMDCEDNLNAGWIHDNPAGSISWKGGIRFDSKLNALFTFCLVPNYFERNSKLPYGYALLATDLDTYEDGVEIWERAFDNEDDNNINYALLDGNQVATYQINNFEFDFSGLKPPDNTLLYFAYYPWQDRFLLDFPPAYGGIPYSLFGKGSYGASSIWAEIQIDDEDDACASFTYSRDHLNSAPFIYRTTSIPNFPGNAFIPGVFNFALPSLSQFYVIQVQ